MTRMALQYEFDECECLAANGGKERIPAGIWPVAERDSAFALVGDRVLTLDAPAFQQLKLEGKVRALSK